MTFDRRLTFEMIEWICFPSETMLCNEFPYWLRSPNGFYAHFGLPRFSRDGVCVGSRESLQMTFTNVSNVVLTAMRLCVSVRQLAKSRTTLDVCALHYIQTDSGKREAVEAKIKCQNNNTHSHMHAQPYTCVADKDGGRAEKRNWQFGCCWCYGWCLMYLSRRRVTISNALVVVSQMSPCVSVPIHIRYQRHTLCRSLRRFCMCNCALKRT